MIAFIEAHREVFGVEPICRVLPIAPATYYARAAIARNPALASDRARQDAEAFEKIKRVHDKSKGRYLWCTVAGSGAAMYSTCSAYVAARPLGEHPQNLATRQNSTVSVTGGIDLFRSAETNCRQAIQDLQRPSAALERPARRMPSSPKCRSAVNQ